MTLNPDAIRLDTAVRRVTGNASTPLHSLDAGTLTAILEEWQRLRGDRRLDPIDRADPLAVLNLSAA